MKYTVSYFILILIASTSLLKASEAQKANILENYDKIPITFTSNTGQLESQVKFIAKGNGITIFFTPEGTTFLLDRETEESLTKRKTASLAKGILTYDENEPVAHDPKIEREYYVLNLNFINANPNPEVIGEEILPWKNNYFIGNEPSKWRTDVPNYSKIRLRSLYDGIDLIYYGNKNGIKCDFVVQPGAAPGQILLSYDFGGFIDKELLRINGESELEVKTPFGNLIKRKPYCYQEINGEKIEIEANYRIIDEQLNIFTLNVSTYNSDFPIFINSEIVYSKSFDVTYDEYLKYISVDGNDNAYVIGYTESRDFPTTTGAFNENYNGGTYDVFVCKLNALGSALVYSTYLGGSDSESARGISVDDNGNAYITGATLSTNFPTTAGAYDESDNGNADGFVCKLNPSGNSLIYSTYIGGSNADGGKRITFDGSGNICIAGGTRSEDFPTTAGAYDENHNGDKDIFLCKLNTSGNALIYSTLLGGSNGDACCGLSIDGTGNVYISGNTLSANFPTTSGAFNESYNGGYMDIFVCKLGASGSSLIYSTFIGGNSSDGNAGIIVDGSGNAYTSGTTRSANFPATSGAYDENHNGADDAFVCKVNSSGSALIYSTFLGGSGYEEGHGISVDGSGNAYIAGYTSSSDFPTTSGAYDESLNGVGSWDVFVSKINPSGNALIYSTLLGGSSHDFGRAMTIDGSGNAYIGGETCSMDFPTTSGAYDENYNGGNYDVFVFKLNSSGNALIYSTYLGGSGFTPVPSDFKIISIKDVPSDQGKQVRISWKRHPNDSEDAAGNIITKYSIWRKIDYNLPFLFQKTAVPVGDWTFVKEVPAMQNSIYNTIVPTLADLTIYYSQYYTTFFVCAHTSNPLIHWETEPYSGYSIDNSLQKLEYALQQNYPNPFNTYTSIKYNISKNSFISLKIYNSLGQEVRTLVNEIKPEGYYKAVWDGTNDNRMKVNSGVYIYRFQAGGYMTTKKMVMLK